MVADLYLLLKNCCLYTPDKKGKNDLLIENGKIKKISKHIKSEKIFKIIDCKNRFVVPGFIDVHIQGAGGKSFIDCCDEKELNVISETLAKYGVTSFLATTVVTKSNQHLKFLGKYRKKSLKGSLLLGIHLEGPFINVNKRGMIEKSCIKKPDIKFLHHLIEITKNFIKMMTIAPELKGNLEIIKELKRFKIVASLGHTMADTDITLKAIKTGITHATHFFNAMPSIHHREPGPVGVIFSIPSITVQIISDGVHIHPLMLNIIFKFLGSDRIVLISDGMPSLGLKDGKYYYHTREYISKNGTCFSKDGTLMGTSLPLNEMAKRMMKFTGASFEETLKMITINPAKTLHLKNKGEIDQGKDADLVVTDKKFNIYATIIGGKICYQKKIL